MKFSVITPSYNRAYILTQCYESLKKQTYKDFEWIIVDDGSSDNTEEVVKSFISDGLLRIRYKKQENGGKHRAHNQAVKMAEGELCVCVDSDDALTKDALSKAAKLWTEKEAPNTIGILALRGDFKRHDPICSLIPQGLETCTMNGLRDQYHFEGDTILFFRTSLLKQHYFREFSGENFLTENNLYLELDQYGEMILSNDVLYLCEYLPDGLSAKYHRIMRENPKGSADTFYRMAVYASSIKFAFKYAVIAQIYKSLTKSEEVQFTQKKILFGVARFVAPVFKGRILRDIEENRT